jgi:hypothetical protein
MTGDNAQKGETARTARNENDGKGYNLGAQLDSNAIITQNSFHVNTLQQAEKRRAEHHEMSPFLLGVAKPACAPTTPLEPQPPDRPPKAKGQKTVRSRKLPDGFFSQGTQLQSVRAPEKSIACNGISR